MDVHRMKFRHGVQHTPYLQRASAALISEPAPDPTRSMHTFRMGDREPLPTDMKC